MFNLLGQRPDIFRASKESFRLLQHNGSGLSRCASSVAFSQNMSQFMIHEVHTITLQIIVLSKSTGSTKPIGAIKLGDARSRLSTRRIFLGIRYRKTAKGNFCKILIGRNGHHPIRRVGILRFNRSLGKFRTAKPRTLVIEDAKKKLKTRRIHGVHSVHSKRFL